MANLTPYLFFNGNCREAMKFYESCFGGKLEIMTYGDAQGEGCPLAQKDKVMHAALTSGKMMLMASDSADAVRPAGDNVSLALGCESLSEIEELFKALSNKGSVSQELQDAFWGDRFGMVKDQFGFHWMLNCPLKK
ncbi:MAG TPA: VOC family protein [Polyangiaceae bacterium]|nr:VOC family protein [Polyangiaceae bacterium]